MQTPVSIQDKKTFIQWFLNHYQMKKRESVWILNYLLSHSQLLSRVHFVRDVKFCPRGILMSSHCSEAVSFRFYKNKLVTTDAEKSFHDIRLNREEPLYIQLNFRQANQNTRYAAVLEENPFIPDTYFITKKDKDRAQQLLDASLIHYQKTKLEKQIDQSLAERDKDRFLHLAARLNDLKKNQPGP